LSLERRTSAPVEEPSAPVKEVEEPETPCGLRTNAPDKKVRVQELAECPDCNKMITPKSLKYSHKKNV
jgi:hypothetical protein